MKFILIVFGGLLALVGFATLTSSAVAGLIIMAIGILTLMSGLKR